jgi:hypothetical protein
MMTTSKSMAPIARRKKPKDGSGITALPLLLAFAIGSELQVDGLVPKQPRRKRQKAMLPMLSDGDTVAAFLSERAHPEQLFEVARYHATIHMDPKMEATMPVLLWLLGVPLVVVIALMLTHVI